MSKGTRETEKIIKSGIERKSSVYAIGPAGENMARFACIAGDHVAAHNGLGAVMGAKKLKANVFPEYEKFAPDFLRTEFINTPTTCWGCRFAHCRITEVTNMTHWESMRRNYYTQMGWDPETGKPSPATLERLGLGHLVSDLHRL